MANFALLFSCHSDHQKTVPEIATSQLGRNMEAVGSKVTFPGETLVGSDVSINCVSSNNVMFQQSFSWMSIYPIFLILHHPPTFRN
jgi:hypothetical protein